MRCPPEKAGAYTAVVVVCAVIAMIVLGAVSSLFVAAGRWASARRRSAAPTLPGAAGGGDIEIKTPGATVTINPSAMADMAKRMEEASKRMESAQQSGDSAAAGKAMGDILGAVTGAATRRRSRPPT